MSRFTNALPKLRGFLEKNSNDVLLATRELVYERKRERVISFTDAYKLMELSKEVEHFVDLSSEDARIITRDGNIIISRTSIDNYI